MKSVSSSLKTQSCWQGQAMNAKYIFYVATVSVFVAIALSIIYKQPMQPYSSPVSVTIFDARERIGNNSNLDNSGGHIDFTARNRWDCFEVVFVDRGFDGTLDEVKICKRQGGGEVTLLYPAGTITPLDDHTFYSQEEWNDRFLEIRREAASATSLPGH